MKIRILTFLYFAVGLLFIIAPGDSGFLIPFMLKALLIPVLAVIYAVSVKPENNQNHTFMFMALFFSWCGDIILELPFDGSIWFIAGLGSFLLAHVMYIILFLKSPGENTVLKNKQYLIIPVLVYGIILGAWLWDGLGTMRIPVMAYTIVILTMVIAAINRLGKVSKTGYFLVLAGAILFTLSDSAIAINKFGHHFNHAGHIIMSTYIAAQFLIVKGYLKQ
jgi:uncharacterized membrane protein YhhN